MRNRVSFRMVAHLHLRQVDETPHHRKRITYDREDLSPREFEDRHRYDAAS